MGREKVARRARVVAASDACLQGAIAVEDAHAPTGRARFGRARARPAARAKAQLRNVDRSFGIDEYLAGPGNVSPCAQIGTLAGEKLNPAILPIGDIDRTASVDRDSMRHVKLPRSAAWFTPRAEEPAFRRKAMNARV